jgi:hypothetical protein
MPASKQGASCSPTSMPRTLRIPAETRLEMLQNPNEHRGICTCFKLQPAQRPKEPYA